MAEPNPNLILWIPADPGDWDDSVVVYDWDPRTYYDQIHDIWPEGYDRVSIAMAADEREEGAAEFEEEREKAVAFEEERAEALREFKFNPAQPRDGELT